jgi:hypothetical protein
VSRFSEYDLANYVERNSDRLLELVRTLIRIPSENEPPEGAEENCQLHIARFLNQVGWNAKLFISSRT